MLSELFEQHQAILAAAHELLAAVRRSPRIGMDELSRYRVRLSNLIRQHHRAEEELVYAPLMRNGGIDRVPQLKQVLLQIQEEKSRYSANVGRWTPRSIMADWEGYAASVAARVEALTALIRAEEERLYRPVMALAAAEAAKKNADRSATG